MCMQLCVCIVMSVVYKHVHMVRLDIQLVTLFTNHLSHYMYLKPHVNMCVCVCVCVCVCDDHTSYYTPQWHYLELMHRVVMVG